MSFDSNNTLTYTFFQLLCIIVINELVTVTLIFSPYEYWCWFQWLISHWSCGKANIIAESSMLNWRLFAYSFGIFFSWSANDVIIWVSILSYSSPCIVMAVVCDKMAAIFQTNFEMHFLEWKITNFDLKMSLKCVHKGLISYIPALIQIMARHRPGDNDGWFTDAYMQHSVSMI